MSCFFLYRNSPSFRSFEEKVENTVSTIKVNSVCLCVCVTEREMAWVIKMCIFTFLNWSQNSWMDVWNANKNRTQWFANNTEATYLMFILILCEKVQFKSFSTHHFKEFKTSNLQTNIIIKGYYYMGSVCGCIYKCKLRLYYHARDILHSVLEQCGLIV